MGLGDLNLSPAAQAIADAFERAWNLSDADPFECYIQPVGAALRAAADQVAPSDADEPRNYLPMAIECQRIRSELLAIAAELENE